MAAKKPNKKMLARRKVIIDRAVNSLRNALIDKGLDPDAALRFAKVALSKSQGTAVGKGGIIRYKNKTYNAEDFAKTPLIDFITGAKAKADNIAAIQGDPNYQQTLAQLGLTRDQTNADLEAQRRSALLSFGDPNFVTNDPILQAAVEANPFSTTQLQRENYNRDLGTVATAANKAGTLLGGGYISGQREAQRRFAGNVAQGTQLLTDQLGSLNMQTGNAGSDYALGQRAALIQAQQALSDAGLLQPETGPDIHPGQIAWWRQPPIPGRGPGRGGPTDGAGGGTGVRTSHYGHWDNGRWIEWHPNGGGRIPNPPPPPHPGPVRGGGGGGGGIPAPPPPRGGGGQHPTGGGIPQPPPPYGGGGSGGGGQIPPPPPPQGRPLPQPPAPYHPPLFHRRHRIPPPPPPLFHRHRRLPPPPPPRF